MLYSNASSNMIFANVHFHDALDSAGNIFAVTVTVTLQQSESNSASHREPCSLPCKLEIQWVAILTPLRELTMTVSVLSVQVIAGSLEAAVSVSLGQV